MRRTKYSKNEILTYTKVIMDPLDIQPDQVRIRDIAHSLSMMTRANGHFKTFYSVAQHSINCAFEAKNRGCPQHVQLACLLHDAAESYIADVTRPVKHRLEGYAQMEQRILSVIYHVFGIADLSNDEKHIVMQIDDAMLYYEFLALMDTYIRENAPYISMQHDFSQLDMRDVEKQFLDLAQELTTC